MSTIEIIPSILTNKVQEASELIGRCDGVVRRVQIDVIDGVFANNKTVLPEDIDIQDVSVAMDFHLMVDSPIDWVERCVNAKADRIIGQIEMMDDQMEFIDMVQKNNLRVGIAIDLDTPVSKINPDVFGIVDVILVMSVKAGFGGQEFNLKALDKVIELSKIRDDKSAPFRICIDGGVNKNNIADIENSGANEVVIGRILFDGPIKDNISKLEGSLE